MHTFFCRGKRKAKERWHRRCVVPFFFGVFDPFRVRISMHIFYCRGKRKTKGKWQRRSVDTCLFAHSVSSFPSPCLHICIAMLDVYKDAHIFLQRKEKSKRKITAFPPLFHLFFVVFDPFWCADKYAHYFCRRKRKIKAKWRRRSVDNRFFAHSASLFQFPCMHIFHLV